MSEDPKVTECIVSADPRLQISCSATPDGLITIETPNGLINILLRHTAIHQSETVNQRILWTLSRLWMRDDEGTSFSFVSTDRPIEIADAGVDQAAEEETLHYTPPLEEDNRAIGSAEDYGSSDDTEEWEDVVVGNTEVWEPATVNEGEEGQLDDGKEGDAIEEGEEEFVRIQSEEEDDEDTSIEENDDGDEGDDAAGTEKSFNPKYLTEKEQTKPISEEKVKRQCQKIKMKIAKNWQKALKQLKKMVVVWIANMCTFFGRRDSVSTEQWAYFSILDLEDDGPIYRVPFFKAFLAYSLIQRVRATGSSEIACRSQMLAELEPGFKGLSRKEKLPKYKQFERCINHGKVFLGMITDYPGLMLTVAPLLAQIDFEQALQHTRFPCVTELSWLDSEKREISKDYAGLATRIFSLIPEYSSNTKRKGQELDISPKRPCLLSQTGNLGPQLQLRTQMKVPDTAQSIQFAMRGDIEGLKYLFNQGLASPRDVSNSRGFSLVGWALYGGMCNYKTVQFLLNCGALVDEEQYQHVWDYAYRRKCSVEELAELRCITLNPPSTYAYSDWVEEQQFPLIHNIIFGRSSKLLRAELDDNPDAVRVKDAMGRTALDWAAARAQLSDMRLLIDHGAPLNTMDVSGRTTVLHAVDSHNDDALRIVLEAGANPNPEVPKGLFRSSPLTAASFGGLVEMIKLLIKFGAKVDACNPEGRTALQAVVSTQNVECAGILLTHGADPAYMSSNGHSPLTAAIICNNHALLKLFIDRCDISRMKGIQLLPIIAESADAETVSILASSGLLKQTLLNGDSFAAGPETLRSRTSNAFEDLCRRASGEAAAFRTADDGIESGLSGVAPVS